MRNFSLTVTPGPVTVCPPVPASARWTLWTLHLYTCPLHVMLHWDTLPCHSLLYMENLIILILTIHSPSIFSKIFQQINQFQVCIKSLSKTVVPPWPGWLHPTPPVTECKVWLVTHRTSAYFYGTDSVTYLELSIWLVAVSLELHAHGGSKIFVFGNTCLILLCSYLDNKNTFNTVMVTRNGAGPRPSNQNRV